MIVLFDNLTATLIGGVILLILVAMQVRLNTANVEQTALTIAKGQALDFGDWIQEDLGNAGSGVAVNQEFIENVEVDPETGNTTRVSFYRKVNPSDASPTMITYELIDGQTVTVDGEEVQLYQLQRCEGASTCPVASASLNGQSAPALSYFNIDFLDDSGWMAGTTGAQYIRIRFAMASVLSDNNIHLREAQWGTVLPLRERDS